MSNIIVKNRFFLSLCLKSGAKSWPELRSPEWRRRSAFLKAAKVLKFKTSSWSGEVEV